MRLLTTAPTARQIDVGLAILRIAVGIVFLAHGGQKLFQFGLGGVTEGFGQMGIPFPGLTGPLVACVEFFGGIALVLGLATRLAALFLAINMLGAMLFVHMAAGFFLPAGVEFALSLFAANLALFFMGPGDYSLDHAISRRRTTTV
jgi:putative oxidoreductase